MTEAGRIGKAEICAKHLKRPLLELGGQAPMVVLDDADLGTAAELAVLGACTNRGQVCMSTEPLIVAEAVADELIDLIESRRKTLVLS